MGTEDHLPLEGGGGLASAGREGVTALPIDRIAVISCAARIPPGTAFGSPILPLQGRVAKCDCPAHKKGEAKEGKS
jgi:hypothetical protein